MHGKKQLMAAKPFSDSVLYESRRNKSLVCFCFVNQTPKGDITE